MSMTSGHRQGECLMPMVTGGRGLVCRDLLDVVGAGARPEVCGPPGSQSAWPCYRGGAAVLIDQDGSGRGVQPVRGLLTILVRTSSCPRVGQAIAENALLAGRLGPSRGGIWYRLGPGLGPSLGMGTGSQVNTQEPFVPQAGGSSPGGNGRGPGGAQT